MFGITGVAAITVICYMISEAWKAAKGSKNKYIPIVAMASGLVLGAVAYIIKMPQFPANDIITAMAVGVASGGAAVAINQVGKQMVK
jgi:hypothetical protein